MYVVQPSYTEVLHLKTFYCVRNSSLKIIIYYSVNGMSNCHKYLAELFLVVGKAVPLADINKVTEIFPLTPDSLVVCSTAQSRGFKFNMILEQSTVMPAICGHGVM